MAQRTRARSADRLPGPGARGMIGILGGTFDPIHFGHLRVALECLQDLGMEEVRLLPCGVPPHRGAPRAAPEERLGMVRAAVAGVPGLATDTRELERPGPSYMADTLESLRGEAGDAPLCLILGTDAFAGLDRWHRWQAIIELAHVVIAERPGWTPPREGPLAELLGARRVHSAAELARTPAGCVLCWPVTSLDISSTDIRAQVAASRSPRFLLPDSVLDYIETHGCYRDGGADTE